MEVYKNGGPDMVEWMQKTFNKCSRSGNIPEEWRCAVICPIFQKGNKADCSNYRGISLLPHILKIYEHFLEHILRQIVEDQLGEWQHGF